MMEFNELAPADLPALGRHALDLCARRFIEISDACEPSDQPLRELLGKMAFDAWLHAGTVEQCDTFGFRREEAVLAPANQLGLIRTYLRSLTKTLGEGLLHRDVALFLAESLEEEASRLFRVLAAHATESATRLLFSDLADREQGNLHYLREIVLQG